MHLPAIVVHIKNSVNWKVARREQNFVAKLESNYLLLCESEFWKYFWISSNSHNQVWRGTIKLKLKIVWDCISDYSYNCNCSIIN